MFILLMGTDELRIIRVTQDLALCAASDGLIPEGTAFYDPSREHLVHQRPNCRDMYFKSRGIPISEQLDVVRVEYEKKR